MLISFSVRLRGGKMWRLGNFLIVVDPRSFMCQAADVSKMRCSRSEIPHSTHARSISADFMAYDEQKARWRRMMQINM